MSQKTLFVIKKDNQDVYLKIFGSGIGVGSFFSFLLAGIVSGILLSGAADNPIPFFGMVLLMLTINFFFMVRRTRPQTLIVTPTHIGAYERTDISEICIENKLISDTPFETFSHAHKPPPSPLWFAFGGVGAAVYVSASATQITNAFGAQMHQVNRKSRAKREFSIFVRVGKRKRYLFKNLKQQQAYPLLEVISKIVFTPNEEVTPTAPQYAAIGSLQRKVGKFFLCLAAAFWATVVLAVATDGFEQMPSLRNIGLEPSVDIISSPAGAMVTTVYEEDFDDLWQKGDLYFSPYRITPFHHEGENNADSFNHVVLIKNGYKVKEVETDLSSLGGTEIRVSLERLPRNNGTGFLYVQGVDQVNIVGHANLTYKQWMELKPGHYTLELIAKRNGKTIRAREKINVHAKKYTLLHVLVHGSQLLVTNYSPR